VVNNPYSPAGAIVVLLWVLATPFILRRAAAVVASGAPLRAADAAMKGPTGLVLTGPGALIPPPPRQVQPHSGVAAWVLRRFEANPFYLAYRRGFMRLYAGQYALPGSALPPAFAFIGGFTYLLGSLTHGLDAVATFSLVTLFIAILFSCLEAVHLGSRAMAAERDQATWPMLIVSGVSPERILQGKFAMTFYAVSGEWTVTLPLWIGSAILTLQPNALLLGALQPACVALAIMLGLCVSAQPRFLVINLKRTAAVGAALIVIAAAFGNVITTFVRVAFTDFFATLWLTTASPTLSSSAHFMVWLAAAAALGVALYRLAVHRLTRLMRGE